jgi:hypothetical protein
MNVALGHLYAHWIDAKLGQPVIGIEHKGWPSLLFITYSVFVLRVFHSSAGFWTLGSLVFAALDLVNDNNSYQLPAHVMEKHKPSILKVRLGNVGYSQEHIYYYEEKYNHYLTFHYLSYSNGFINIVEGCYSNQILKFPDSTSVFLDQINMLKWVSFWSSIWVFFFTL